MILKPRLKFNAKLPDILGNIVGQGSKWDAVTIPGDAIYFQDAKDKVKTSLYKHELRHWYDGQAAPLLFLAAIAVDYKINGHGKSYYEKRAKDYANSGPLTAIEQAWWDAAK